MLIVTSIASWAEDPYFEVIDGSFASGNVTVKATFPDATSVEGVSGAWVYLIYNGNKNWNNGTSLYASGSKLSFEGNTFTATYSFICPAGAIDYDFSLSPYNNDIKVDGVGQPGSLVINLKACTHESLTFHAETVSTERVHGHEAYNECTSCGKLFRTSDTGHTTPLTIMDLDYPYVCDHPYYEVVSGSIADGNPKIRLTFPQASVVTLTEAYQIYQLLYGSGETYYSDHQVALAGPTNATLNRNSIIVDYTKTTLDIPVGAVDNLYYIYIYANSVLIDGVANSDMIFRKAFEEEAPAGCEHTNCTSHPAVEPTETTPGNIAYVQCDDCEKYFAATDTEHTTPLEWSAIELTFCTHEHIGADDICADCNRVFPHAPRIMTWTVNGITATYNKVARSLTFSGEGTMPEVDLFSFAEDQRIAKLIETYPWYEVLNPRLETDWMGTNIVVDAVATVTIENGVHFNTTDYSYNSVQYLIAGVFYDHTTEGWQFNSGVIVVDNEDAKASHPYANIIFTPAELASMGVTSFPSDVFFNNYGHICSVSYTKEPECPYYSSYNSYCPVCGFYSNGNSAWGSAQVKHDYNYAGICYNCGAKNPATCAHTNVNSYAAVASTADNHGHIAFKKCSDCGQYFAADDASCATALDFDTQVLLPLAAPACVHVMNEMTAKCTYLYSTYYACEVCGHFFADAEGLTEISEADVNHSFDGVDEMCAHGCGKHDPTMCTHYSYAMEYHERVNATCTEDGMFEHHLCTYCDALFDYNLNPTTAEALKLPATGHIMNYYKVCSNCGLEGEGAMHCYHTSLTPLGDNRTSCTQTTDYVAYYHCENCERFLSFEDGLYTSILKSDIQYTPGSQLHHNHLMVYNPGALCTQTSYSINFKECTDCRRKYFSFADDDLCTIVSDFELSDSYLDTKMSSPVGHNFENGSHVCSRCGFDAVYRQATVDSEIKPGAHYILVSKIGDQYYAFGKPGKEDRWYMGYLGFDAVPVNMEADGRIAVTSNDVMTLYTYGYLEAPYDGGQLQKDGTRSRTYDLSFYNPVYGSIYHNNTEDDIIEKNKYVVLDQTTSWFINETEAMNVHISNGEKRFYGYENILFRVDDERFPQYGSQLIEQGALVYSMPDWSGSPYQGFHAMYLGQNNGQEPRFHVPGFVRYHYPYTEPEYEAKYPVYLYLLDTKKFINAENTTAANVSGPVTKADVMSIFTKAKDSYDVNVAQLEASKQRYPDTYADYEVKKSSYQFTTIDLSKARISDGDLTYQDIMAMKNNEFSAPNVIIVLPETSGASSAKARKASSDDNSLASIPNVIVNGTCQTLALEDKQTMNVPVDFTAGNVTYSRSGVSSAWGTLCLPYAISSDEKVQLYKLTEVDNSNADGTMTFKPIAEAVAGQPVVFKKLDAGATTLSFDKEDAQLTIAGFNGESTEVAKWELLGTYEQAKIISDKDFGRYYIAQNKFWNAKNEATVPAFRAWFEYEKNSASQAASRSSYMIFIEDDDANVTNVLTPNKDGELEECTEIYDLSGKKLTAPIKGQINIINGKKIFVK